MISCSARPFPSRRPGMSCLLLVPAKDQEKLLSQNIAGLTLAVRLYHHSTRAGIDYTAFIVEDESGIPPLQKPDGALLRNHSEIEGKGFQRCILCRPGILPDIPCLRWLKEVEIKDHELLELPGISIFIPSSAGFELENAFQKDGYFRLLDFLHTFLKARPIRCEQGRIFDLTRPENRSQVEKELFRSLIKDTEGFMSRLVERPISLAISKRLVNTSITPNQVTLISILIGLVGALFISIDRGFWQILGSMLFLLHSIVDGCDGEIARIKFMESRLGGILDFWGDNIVHAAVFTAIGLEWWRHSGSAIPLLLAATAVAGTFLCAMIVYVSTMKKKSGSGPLYTSVSASEKKTGMVKIADFLSRRDFIYLVVILAFYRHLDWFLAASATGTMVFLAMLIRIRTRAS